MKNIEVLLLFSWLAALNITAKCSKPTIEQVAGPFTLGEGPHWDEENQVLYFVDIPEKKMLCLNPSTKKVTEAYLKNGPVGVAVPVADKKNTFIAGNGKDIVEVKWDPTSNNPNPDVKILATVDVDRTDNRINDGKVDPAGRFWVGTMHQKGQQILDERGALYRFDTNGTPTKIISPVTISNGLCWSHDNKKFYYIDSPTLEVVAYDYNIVTGDIANKKLIFSLKENNIPGVPDGMTIDKHGHLWVAVHEGSRVLEIDPLAKKLLRTITMPASRITSVAFGGPNYETLYVTSAKEGLSPEELKKQPAAGYLFAVHGLGVTGVRALDAKM